MPGFEFLVEEQGGHLGVQGPEIAWVQANRPSGHGQSSVDRRFRLDRIERELETDIVDAHLGEQDAQAVE